mmetsp:Transcript_27432/g.56777  ORF Transcript_27432/g.56777 Transcript_27432/m.56777 type:complete len:260 (+) Transcript_27432:892-1671(+)
MLPFPDVQSPAIARSRLDLPAPEFPTIRRFSPSCSSMERSLISVRLRSGVARSRSWIEIMGVSIGLRYAAPFASPLVTPGTSAGKRINWMVENFKALSLLTPRLLPLVVVCTLSDATSTTTSSVFVFVAFAGVMRDDLSSGSDRIIFRSGSASCIASKKTDNRSMPAENLESCSNWLTMMLRSFRMWLKAPTDWLMTPSSMAPAKYRGATTVTGRSWIRNRYPLVKNSRFLCVTINSRVFPTTLCSRSPTTFPSRSSPP